MVQVQSRRAVILASLIAVASMAPSAQMGVTVQSDRVLLGHHGEFVPRFATYLPTSLIVAQGQIVTLQSATYEAIEVQSGGVLRCVAGATVRFTHLQILPGGLFDCQASTTLIIRDVPIDMSRDPFQWGNGIVNFGRRVMVGTAKTTHTELTADAPQGAASIAVADASGWQVGDELLFADMRPGPARRETPVVISSISGNTVGLSKPLDFEHASIRDPDGGLVLRPRVANLTRDIVIRSEAPGGTRGHTVNIGPFASWDIRYNEFVAMGRTLAEPLNNTSLDLSRIGTNQIGKYADHDHHAQGVGSQHIGNSYIGAFGAKWGVAVHGTHDVLVQDNVCIDFMGGCYATEDGYEVRNVFRSNVAAFTVGTRPRFALADRNVAEGCPGCESAFWFRGVHNTADQNEAWNTIGTGINLFNMLHVALGTMVPSQPGGPYDLAYTEAVARAAVPISFADNVSIGSSTVGAEYWAVNRFPTERLIAANDEVGVAVILAGEAFLKDPVIQCGNSETATGLTSSAAYSTRVDVEGGSIRGCAVGATDGLGRVGALIRNVLMQNRIDVDLVGTLPIDAFVLDHVTHRQLGSFAKQYIRLAEHVTIWQPGQPFPRVNDFEWNMQGGSKHRAIAHHGVEGDDFEFFTPAQEASLPAPCGEVGYKTHAVPECGLTMGQAWDKYGIAFRGAVYRAAEAVGLEGLVNTIARRLPSAPLGPSRAILVFPTPSSFVVVEDTYGIGLNVPLTIRLTGQPSSGLRVTVDGVEPIEVGSSDPAHRIYRTTTGITPGTHTVVTERGGQAMTFTYCVGTCGEPPPPPPPLLEVCGDGIDNDNDGLIDEGFIAPAVRAEVDLAKLLTTFFDAAGCRLVK